MVQSCLGEVNHVHQLTINFKKSKADQAEREAERKEAEERRAAQAAAEAERQRQQAASAAREELARSAASDRDWERFCARPDDAAIGMRDVPWPVLDAASLGLDPRHTPSAAERKARFRQQSLRWHPDKFVQAFGGRLDAAERDAVLQRVTEVSQAINALYQQHDG